MPEATMLPGPRDEMQDATVTLWKAQVEWLDQIASNTNRNRSEVLREILDAVKANEKPTRSRK